MGQRQHKLDIVGDVPRQLQALQALGRHLGYRVDEGWTHPEGAPWSSWGISRTAGPTASESSGSSSVWPTPVAPSAVMGNHEFNLVGWGLGRMRVKSSNRDTCEAILQDRGGLAADPRPHARAARWRSSCPASVVHAVWHAGAFGR
jgi:hypothetical protein